MKYLYFQDGHVKGKNSAYRIGNYFQDFLIKFDELLEIAKEHQVDAILDGGDLTHAPEPSYRILDEIADRVEKTKIPFIGLFGNHAERYHSMEHSKYTGLAHLIKRSKYFNYLTEIKGDDFIIESIEYSHNIEEKIKESGLMFVENNMWKIGIIHAFVTPKPFLPQVMHVCCKDISSNADIILVAHYHSEWEKQVGSTIYKDIGCFGRNSITEANLTPSCLLIDTTTRTITEIELKSAKKGKDIFEMDKVAEIKEFNSNMENFIKSLESTEFQSMNIKGMIEDVAKKSDVSREVVDLIINKIEVLNAD